MVLGLIREFSEKYFIKACYVCRFLSFPILNASQLIRSSSRLALALLFSVGQVGNIFLSHQFVHVYEKVLWFITSELDKQPSHHQIPLLSSSSSDWYRYPFVLQSLKSFLGEEELKVWYFPVITIPMKHLHDRWPQTFSFMQEFINFTLHFIADLDIPIKRLVAIFYSEIRLPFAYGFVSLLILGAHSLSSAVEC